MGNRHEFTLRIHHSGALGRIHLLWPCDAESLQRFDSETFADDSGERDMWDGKCFFSEKIDAKSGMPTAIIALKNWEANAEDIALLAHECLHAVQWMLKQLNLKPQEQFDEWEDSAYMLEWIMKRALAKLLADKDLMITKEG